MPKKDKPVKEAIEASLGIAQIGRRKVVAKVQRKYPEMSESRIRRVYQNEGFSLYKRLRNKRLNNPANPIEVPLQKNVEWAMDFMSDSLANGRKIRTLNIVDQYNRQCLHIGIDHSISSRKVIEMVQMAMDEYGKPVGIRTDNGPEFTSRIFQDWLEKQGINWVKIQKGKPQQNAIVERFNRTYREDVLDANLFFSLEHAVQKTADWIQEYNNERPHEALNNLTPNEYVA
jgi:putative transposase